MGSRGSDTGQRRAAFEGALAQGNLGLASACAKDLGALDLDHAARLLHLMARERSPLYNKAAARWMRRYVEETRNVTPEQIAEVADALAEMSADPTSAEVLLATLGSGWA